MKFPFWPAVLSGTVLSLSICLGGGFITALWIGFSNEISFDLSWFLRILGIASVFLGGLASGRQARSNGWAHGGLAGLLYVLILMLPMVSIFHVHLIWRDILLAFFLSASIAAIGGVVGINLPSRQRRRLPMAGN